MSSYTFTQNKVSSVEFTNRSVAAATSHLGASNKFFVVDSSIPKKSARGSFKSSALTLEVELSEALRAVTEASRDFVDDEFTREQARKATLNVFRQLFDKIIAQDTIFSSLLSRIKAAYESMSGSSIVDASEMETNYETLLLEYSKLRAELAENARMYEHKCAEADGYAEDNALLRKKLNVREQELQLMSDRFQTSGEVFLKQKALQQRISEVEAQAEMAVAAMQTSAPRSSRPPSAAVRSSGSNAGQLHLTEEQSAQDKDVAEFLAEQIKKDIEELETQMGVLRVQEQAMVDKHAKLKQKWHQISGTDWEAERAQLAAAAQEAGFPALSEPLHSNAKRDHSPDKLSSSNSRPLSAKNGLSRGSSFGSFVQQQQQKKSPAPASSRGSSNDTHDSLMLSSDRYRHRHDFEREVNDDDMPDDDYDDALYASSPSTVGALSPRLLNERGANSGSAAKKIVPTLRIPSVNQQPASSSARSRDSQVISSVSARSSSRR
jgi:hypothetical protein